MRNELKIKFASIKDIPLIGSLASQVWPATYKYILSPEQMEYMLSLFYSPEALKDQFCNQSHTFLLVELEDMHVGFASYSKIDNSDIFKLHKLYILPMTQGKGVGKAIIEFILQQIISLGGSGLQLNVNRNNNARSFYERNGFSILREEDIDIGNNYFMNDYVMEKKLNV